MAPTPVRKFFVLTLQGDIGPVDRDEVRELLRSGKVRPGDQVRTASGRNLGTVAGIISQDQEPAGADSGSLRAVGRRRPARAQGPLGMVVIGLAAGVVAVVVAWAATRPDASAEPDVAQTPAVPATPHPGDPNQADPARVPSPAVPDLPTPDAQAQPPAPASPTAVTPAPAASPIDPYISAIAFTVFDGQAAWGPAGTVHAGSESAWFTDQVPAGAVLDPETDGWHWADDPLVPGHRAHLAPLAMGAHQHYFDDTEPGRLPCLTTDLLYAYIRLDPQNPPHEVMLQWKSGNDWQHRAYWGDQNIIGWTAVRIGPLPVAGSWVRLEVQPQAIGLVHGRP